MTSPELRDALDDADAHPGDVTAQIRAAYACDREGEETLAIRYYDLAWQLGVPASEMRAFVVGYGSTLRNVGRADDAIAILGQAAAEYPDYAPIKTFLALALHDAGHVRAALATALDVILDLGKHGPLDGYERALAHYHQELLDADLSPSTDSR